MRKTRSILEELNQISVDRDRNHVVSNRGEHIIVSAINLIEQIESHYDEKTAKDFNKKFLGKIPISTKLRESADLGLPLTYKEPDHEISKAFDEIADKIMQDVA